MRLRTREHEWMYFGKVWQLAVYLSHRKPMCTARCECMVTIKVGWSSNPGTQGRVFQASMLVLALLVILVSIAYHCWLELINIAGYHCLILPSSVLGMCSEFAGQMISICSAMDLYYTLSKTIEQSQQKYNIGSPALCFWLMWSAVIQKVQSKPGFPNLFDSWSSFLESICMAESLRGLPCLTR